MFLLMLHFGAQEEWPVWGILVRFALPANLHLLILSSPVVLVSVGVWLAWKSTNTAALGPDPGPDSHFKVIISTHERRSAVGCWGGCIGTIHVIRLRPEEGSRRIGTTLMRELLKRSYLAICMNFNVRI